MLVLIFRFSEVRCNKIRSRRPSGAAEPAGKSGSRRLSVIKADLLPSSPIALNRSSVHAGAGAARRKLPHKTPATSPETRRSKILA
jgi:hypothetical protein